MSALLRNLVGAQGKTIIATEDMGLITGSALKGLDYSRTSANFKQPAGLFSPPSKVGESEGTKLVTLDVYSNSRSKSDSQILNQLKAAIAEHKPRMVVIPQVSSSGKVLPVEKIGEFIRQFNAENGTNIAFVVDGVQAIGRVGAQSLNNPLRYCDGYFIAGHKALGSMTAAALIARPEFIERNAANLVNSPYAQKISHYQFPVPPREIASFLRSRPEHFAISLPEIQSMQLALEDFYERGKGRTFSQRRRTQMGQIRRMREFVVGELEKIPSIKVLGGQKSKGFNPAIITFKVKNARKLKEKLQKLSPPITLAISHGADLLRIGLSELKEQDLPRLLNAIRENISISE